MTLTVSQHDLLDAVKMTADSDTLLDYALLPNPNPLTVGAAGTTLTLLVSNPSDVVVTCKKITVTIPVGTNAQDLTASSDIGSQVPAGWNVSGAFILTPKPGEETIAQHGLAFVFTKINVNDEPGTCALSISETAATGSDTPKIRKATIPVAKFPKQFAVSSLSVTPVSVPSGGTTQVAWNGSPATYVLGYNDGSGYAEHPVGNNGPYDAKNLKRSPTVFFTLTVTVTVPGQTSPLTLQRQAIVEVVAAKPAITSFTGILVGERQVKFSFASTGADSCRLSGSPQPFNPTATTAALDIDRTRYTLIAHNAASGLDSDVASLTVRWGEAASAQIAPRASGLHSRLFLTPDGATLIAVTDQTSADQHQIGNGVYLVNTSNLTARTIFADSSFCMGNPALSRDGKRLLFALSDARAGFCLTIRNAPAFDQGPVVNVGEIGGSSGNWSAFSADGWRAYTVGMMRSDLQVRAANDFHKLTTFSVPEGGPLEISADGGEIFVAGNGKIAVIDSVEGKLVRTMSLTAYAHPFGLLFDPVGKRIYAMEPGNEAIDVVDVGSSKLVGTAKVTGGPWHAALSPWGDAIFVTRMRSNSLAVVDVESLAVIAEIPIGEPSADLAFSPNGQRLYVLTSSGKVLALKRTEVK